MGVQTTLIAREFFPEFVGGVRREGQKVETACACPPSESFFDASEAVDVVDEAYNGLLR